MKPLQITSLLLHLTLCFICCSSNNEKDTEQQLPPNNGANGLAVVTQVTVSSNESGYTFSVTIESPDAGCEQYADWWEVLDLEGNLIYRRILAHSHVNEQPFTRSGSPVEINAGDEIYIRAHMNNLGYGTKVFKGSVTNGFAAFDLSADFAKALENEEPQPSGCAF